MTGGIDSGIFVVISTHLARQKLDFERETPKSFPEGSMRIPRITFTVMAGLLLVTGAQAAVPQYITYQGRLTDDAGNPVPDTSYNFAFTIYNDIGEELWSSGPGIWIVLTDGLFSVSLGETPMEPLPDSMFAGGHDLYLGISVNGETEISPRAHLTPVPYSITALSAAPGAITNEMIADTSIGFEKLAHNNGEPGDILAFAPSKYEFSYVTWLPFEEMATLYLPPDPWVWNGYGVVTTYTNSYIGIREQYPLGKLHIETNSVSLQESALWNDDLIIEDTDAIIGLYSDASGSVGSAIYLNELDGDGNLVDKWSIFRETTTGGLDLRFTYGSNPNAANNSSALRLTTAGRAICRTLEITGGADLSEPFEFADDQPLTAGMVVIIDPENPGRLTVSNRPYDTRVAGIISGAGGINPGVTMSSQTISENGREVAIAGRVYCLADASSGAIRPGDLLTTSSIPGHAMKACDRERCYGTVIGKAMSSLDEGRGLVLVLVSLQ